MTKQKSSVIILRLAEAGTNKSGCGAVGSALPWGGRGRRFKSCHSEKTEIRMDLRFSFVFSFILAKSRVFAI